MGDGCCGSIYLAGVAEPESGVTNGVGKERIWRATKCDAAVTGRDYLFRGCDAGALTICFEVSLYRIPTNRERRRFAHTT